MLKKIIDNGVWKFLTAISPIGLLFFCLAYAEDYFLKPYAQNELTQISGELVKIRNGSAVVKTEDGRTDLKFECLCDYGWGYKSFEQGEQVTAIGEKDGRTLKTWDLQIGQKQVITYKETRSKKAALDVLYERDAELAKELESYGLKHRLA